MVSIKRFARPSPTGGEAPGCSPEAVYWLLYLDTFRSIISFSDRLCRVASTNSAWVMRFLSRDVGTRSYSRTTHTHSMCCLVSRFRWTSRQHQQVRRNCD
jgi:hypothetical protein